MESSALSKIASAGIIAVMLGGGIWVGAIQSRVEANETAIDSHKVAEIHPRAGQRLTTVEVNQNHIQEDVEEIKEDVKAVKAELEAAKREILEAIKAKD